MPTVAIIILLLSLTVMLAVLIPIISRLSKTYYNPDGSHITISDKEILELIAKQKDRLLDRDTLMKETGMEKSVAKKRITVLSIKGLVKDRVYV